MYNIYRHIIYYSLFCRHKHNEKRTLEICIATGIIKYFINLKMFAFIYPVLSVSTSSHYSSLSPISPVFILFSFFFFFCLVYFLLLLLLLFFLFVLLLLLFWLFFIILLLQNVIYNGLQVGKWQCFTFAAGVHQGN